jgi:hypothetical protein
MKGDEFRICIVGWTADGTDEVQRPSAGAFPRAWEAGLFVLVGL